MSKAADLQALYQKLEAQAPTLPLATTATDIVPGEGNPEAEIMFIGEAPGENEAIQRRPFVGKSGQLFRKTLNATGITEKDVYISNIVKVRPPENRDPLPSEIEAYRPYLNQEIAIIKPLLIATLGRFSMAKFLANVKVSQVHGRLHKVEWQQQLLYVLPLYHPAAALRAPKMMQAFTDDLQKLPKIIQWIKAHQDTEKFKSEIVSALL